MEPSAAGPTGIGESSPRVLPPTIGAPVAPESPLLSSLNPVQREAVLHTDGPVLIVAGAGSGKTRILTHRMAHLIREKGVSPYGILAITFTNRAANEMAERVQDLLGERVAKGMWVLTFHSSCVRILRREHTRLGLPSSFSIYDESDTQRVVALCLKEANLDPKRFPPRGVAAVIGKAKDHLISPEDFSQQAANFYERAVADVYRAYQRRLQTAGALDFDDIIMRTVQLFRAHPDVLGHYQERFPYILIDEYQDTNRAQYHLVNLLAAKHRNLCVVGDADQGVYSWRGATIQNLLDFEKDYPDAAVFVLEQNYRSTQNILSVANALIEHNLERKPKSLWTEAPGGEMVVRVRANDEHDEAWFIAEEMARLTETEGFANGDLAIFYRTNAQSRVLEDVLSRAGVPYRVVGGVRFYERRGDQGPDRLPAPAGEPGRPGLGAARDQRAEARHRGHHRGRPGVVRRGRGPHVHGGRPPAGRELPARRAREGCRGRLRRDHGQAPRPARGRQLDLGPGRGGLHRVGLPGRASRRSAPSRPRAAWRTSASSWAWPRSSRRGRVRPGWPTSWSRSPW